MLRRRSALLAAFALTVATAIAAGPVVAGASASESPDRAAAASTRVIAQPAPGSVGAPLDRGVSLAVQQGRLRTVTLTAADGSRLPGLLSADGTWYRSSALLAPATEYALRARVETRTGEGETKVKSRTYRFTTVDPAARLDARLSPGDDVTVGVGQPIALKFNQPVVNKAAVERRLKVRTSRPVTGAWRWFSDTEVRYRPADYWPANIEVWLDADLRGVDAGNGVWGDARRTLHFFVGDAHVSIANTQTHTLSVYENGQLIRSFPMSAGNAENPTMSGKHIVLEVLPEVVMDSRTNGIPLSDPDGYVKTVYWDVRISWSGEYVHAAPWSVSSQGRANVSHGCINLSDANAKWFHDFSRRGDVVEVVGTPKPPNSDGGVVDWKYGFDEWAAGSALGTAPPSTRVTLL